MTAARALACAAAILLAQGCGTMMYPRRSVMPAEERDGFDWGTASLDLFLTAGLGLAVDFIHGTIWLPKSTYCGPGNDPGLFHPRPGPPSPRP